MKTIRHVHIVDDSATARMFIRRCLEIAGLGEAEFSESGNGMQALAHMRSNRPDLLVTDLVMPEMPGEELLTRMMASPRLHGIPVLVISSQTNEAAVERLHALGARAILRKPVSPASVMPALERISKELEEEA